AETPTPQPMPAVLVQAVAAAPDHREMNFHNPVAVRVGLSMASAAALLSWLPLVNFGFVIWWVAAGFCSVYLYHRRTGELLSVRNGLRIGWITGILTFAMMTVLFTISIIPLAVSNGGLAGLYQEQIRNMPVHDANMDQALRMFQTPSGLATILLFTLVVFFGIITFLCTAGGALGAKIVGRE
ncbi:MAG TPA: hypothetical protein VG672_26840, partial [Bryobacteraceae bacterium]|nr:hypothetical protein [Bryobacteraceae bacterium]